VRRRRTAISAVTAILFATLAAACGGSSGTTTTTATTTATATTTGGGAGNQHLTSAQWQKYQADAAAFRSVNLPTLTKVAKCASATNPPAGYVEKCVGDSLTKLATATTKLENDLKGFVGTVGGACAAALNSYVGYATQYQASIKTLQQQIPTNNTAAIYKSAGTLKTARQHGQQLAATFEQACKPA
jgi:hypothetical protein